MECRRMAFDSPHIDEAKQLYLTAFPKEERMSWDDLALLNAKGDVDFLGFFEGEKLLGCTYTFNQPKISWLFYFAVEPDVRGRGIGSHIIQYILKDFQGKRLIIDIEDANQPALNAEQRHRRYDFYRRMGFVDYGVKRMSDPVLYNVMSYGGPITLETVDELVKVITKQLDRK